MFTVDEVPVLPEEAQSLAVELIRLLNSYGYRLNRVLPKDGSEGFTSYTVATRPAGVTGAIIYVSDGGAGAVFQGWNGAAWVNLG